MASLSSDPNGNRTVQFVGTDGKRRSVRLGKVPVKAAEEVRRRVEYLAVAQISGTAPDADTARWLAQVGDQLHGRLAAVGLAVPRQAAPVALLGAFVDGYIARRADVKKNTRKGYGTARRRLLAFFGPDKPLADVTPADADDYLRHLRAGYAPGTARVWFRAAQQFFRAAARARLIAENPFAGIKAPGQADPAKQFFITRDMARRILDACPDYEWRLIFALSRYGGLRCPSEHLQLEWTDVDWGRDRFRVTSPKTEHHEGKGERWVPIFPELRPFLEEAFERALPGATHVITRTRNPNANLRNQLVDITRKAGLVPWPKPFQNLRSSRETELAEVFPTHVVCGWLGNSQPVALKHYLQTTEEHYAKAARGEAVQNPVQQVAAPPRTESNDPPTCEAVQPDATICDNKEYFFWKYFELAIFGGYAV
jgi:integrase